MAVARCLGLGLVLGQFPDFARLGDARLLPVHRALAGQFVLRVAQGPVVKLKSLTNADFICGLSLRNPFIHNLGPSTRRPAAVAHRQPQAQRLPHLAELHKTKYFAQLDQVLRYGVMALRHLGVIAVTALGQRRMPGRTAENVQHQRRIGQLVKALKR